MQISVRTLRGEEIPLEAQPTDTVRSVKIKIQDRKTLRVDLQRLVFQNKQLDNGRSLSSYGIDQGAIIQLIERAAENSNIVAGGYGLGDGQNKLCFPYGLAVDDDGTMIIADWGNHRVVQWKMGDRNGQVIAGGRGPGKELNQLNCPTDLLLDKQTNSLIICDRGNNRVVRWSRSDDTTEGELLLSNIACWGLAMDNDRFLYVSDTKNNEVRRYQIGRKDGTLVAGGHGRGFRLSQLNMPTHLFVDQHQAVYVSDVWNHRVMKWPKDAKEGTIVFSGSPRGLFVDASENVYVADYGNHRLVRWSKEKVQDAVIADGAGKRDEEDQLYYPWGLCCSQQGQLFVADHLNHRIQRFPVQPAN